VDTANRPEEIEVILAVDEDDTPSHSIARESLAVKTVVLPPGMTMGSLNRACFDASSGRYVMLINDDVIVRTQGWDAAVYRAFARYGDDWALVHVNDLLFREQLCTFPILSRKACLEIGICPACYRRYRIDDHIYDTYHLLACLGHDRLIYLEDVVFEHQNYLTSGGLQRHTAKWSENGDRHPASCARSQPDPHDPGASPRFRRAANFFRSEEGKVYVLNPEVFEADSRDFVECFEDRKRDARRLARRIETAALESRQAEHETLLARFRDPYRYRQPYGRPAVKRRSSGATVAVLASDVRRRHVRKCLSLLKRHTPDLDLVVLDRDRNLECRRPEEINKVLRAARTDFVVLLDDDVLVAPGWLEGLLQGLDAQTGIVTPLHRNGRGSISYSGVYWIGDEEGGHGSTTDMPLARRVCQCISGAAVLIDRRKCEGIFFNEAYRDAFFDLDYALQVWEAGYEVACTPEAIVTRLGGGAASSTGPESLAAVQRDSAAFAATWIKSGRIARLQRGMWSQFDYLRNLAEIPQRIQRALSEAGRQDMDELRRTLDQLTADLRPFPKFYETLRRGLSECAAVCRARGEADRAGCLERAADECSLAPLSLRILRCLKQRLAPSVSLGGLPKTVSLAGRQPWAQRTVTTVRAKAASAWRRYQDLPKPVRSVLDPPVNLLKRVVRPLLRTPERVDLGLYRGFRLVRIDDAVQAVPTPCMRRALESIGGDGTRVFSAVRLSRVKDLIDDLAGAIDGNLRGASDLLRCPAVICVPDQAVEAQQGARVTPYEGRSFAPAESPVSGRTTGGAGECGPSWVGCSLQDVRRLVEKTRLHGLPTSPPAARPRLEDETFDLCYSIDALEHCRDPYAVLNEMKRVTKKGGCVYVRTGPLYYSPFGHHILGYFDDFPWIHLRLPPDGILDYCRRRGIDRRIRQALGRSAEDYLRAMMSGDSINGLAYQEYRVTEFLESPDLEVLGFLRVREGEDLLSEQVLRELPDIPREDLVFGRFELAVRRR